MRYKRYLRTCGLHSLWYRYTNERFVGQKAARERSVSHLSAMTPGTPTRGLRITQTAENRREREVYPKG